MDVHLISVSSIIILFFFLTILPPSYCDEDDPFGVCNRTYTCGSVNISYPFWGGSRSDYCGGHQGYKLSCINNEYPVIRIEAQEFRVININTSSRSFTIARLDLWGGPCPPNLLSTTLDYNLFDYTSNVENVTILYGCPPQDLEYNSILSPNRFNCSQLGVPPDGKMNAYFVDKYPSTTQLLAQLTEVCENNTKVLILNSSAIALLEDRQGGGAAVEKAMKQGFEVEYSIGLDTHCRSCETSGGVCGSNSTQPFVCYCSDQVQPFTCPPKAGAGNLIFKVMIAVLGV